MKKISPIIFFLLSISVFPQIPTDNLVLYFPFNGNSIDESGNANDGTVSGAILTDDRFGNTNNAYSFDGINDIITIIDNNSLDLSNKFSISVWINSVDNSNGLNYNHIIGKWGQVGTASYILHTIKDSGNPKLAINDGINNYGLVSSQEILENQWYHFVGIQRDDTFEIFINGILTDTYTMPVPVSPLIGNGDITIGDSSDSKQTFNGIIDDIRIYNRALSSTEISSLYYENINNPPTDNLTYIPDDNFEQALINLGYDDVLDDYVITSNISGVTALDIGGKEISDLSGIGDFEGLTQLNCNSNQLIDLDVTQNTNLTDLRCASNQLTDLDVTQNINLTSLYCERNQLIDLDVTQNTNLTYLRCEANQLTDLDVTQNIVLTDLNCWGNQLIDLDVTQNTNLKNLTCGDNQLTDLDVTQNNVLTDLYCGGNQLIDLDVTQNTNLAYLRCDNNQLTDLDVTQNNVLTDLNCRGNQLTDLDVTQNSSLEYLSCGGNQLTDLDVTQNNVLTNLDFGDNQLTDLDVTQNTVLTRLDCGDNQFIDLDVTQNTSLQYLICGGNQLTDLDVTQNNVLIGLSCGGNQLTDLDLNQHTALKYLNCEDNQLSSLNVKNGNNSLITYFVSTNNTSLQCIQVDNESDANNAVSPYDTWEKDATATYSEDCSPFEKTYMPDDNFEQALIDLGYDDILDDYVLTSNINSITSLDVSSKDISDLTGIQDFKSLTQLYCYNNYLTSLKISELTSLNILNCGENYLSSLDVIELTSLTELSFRYNNLTSIDVSNLTSLINLSCSYNYLTSLDVIGLTSLTYLYCDNNNLTDISMSGLTSITYLEISNNNLTNIDVSELTLLDNFHCWDNKFTDLDLSNNVLLKYVNCSVNQLTNLNVKNGKNIYLQIFDSVDNPNLSCIQVDDETDANLGIGVYSNWQKDDTSTYSEDCSTYLGVDDELLSQSIMFYPNPVTNILSIKSETIPIDKIEIYSVIGKKIKEINSEFSSISTDNLSKGIYIIRIYSEKGTTVRKLIKQ